VTVFGYSAELFPQVLKLMQPSSSALLAHRQGPGNWVHLR
jgi:hypothetical protein